MKPRISLIIATSAFFASFKLSVAILEDATLTYEQLYQSGKLAYTAKEWMDCVGFMRRAVEDFNYYNDEVLWCREMCVRKFPRSSEETGMFEVHRTAQKALCLFRCKRDRLSEQRPPQRRHLVWFDLEEREPYRYMHICYWNLKDLSNAVKAAYTYLVRNPEHEETIQNLQFYMKQTAYKEDMLADLLQKDYEKLYMDGVAAYQNDDWTMCVTKLEMSLQKVLEEEVKCRLDCSDKIDWSSVEGTLEIEIILTSMRASVLRCQSQCFDRISWINGHKLDHIVASHFEYLHICQYNLMRGVEACQSVANYLLFDNSPAMRRNRLAYLRQYGKEDLFEPDPKMVELYKQHVLEKRLLAYIDREFKVSKAGQMTTESSVDRESFNAEVEIKDEFPYNEVEKLLQEGECKVLRSPIRNHIADLLEAELAVRVSERLGLRIVDSASSGPASSCSAQARHAPCERALVLSIDEKSCSMWLPPHHDGCSIVFCAEKT